MHPSRNPSPPLRGTPFGRAPQDEGGGERAAAAISIRPANEASWDDLKSIFGTRGEAAICWCQRYKLQPREAFKHWPPEVRAERLRGQTHCGDARCEDDERPRRVSRRRAGRLVRG